MFLALGSNLGDRMSYLRAALDSLPDVVAVSSVYETEPVGGSDDQGAYLNAVVELSTTLQPAQLLDVTQSIELKNHRVRIEKNGPRTLDIDILLFGDRVVDLPDLQIPHPRMWVRRFVLEPLAELAPELVPEGWESEAIGSVWRAGRF